MNSLCGLVLAGGRSRRMGRPKENLDYHGVPEAQRIYNLLEELTDGAYYSVRTGQTRLPPFADGRKLVDRMRGGGPLGALWSAFRSRRDVSWLLVPVDMPLLERADIEALIGARRPGAGIVAYEGGGAGWLPLPAVYESELSDSVMEMVGCGRGAIIGLGDENEVIRLKPADSQHLVNINTARERNRVLEVIHGK